MPTTIDKPTMQVRRNFKPEVAEKLENIPIEELEKFLTKFKQKKSQSLQQPKESRWQKIAKRVKNDPELKSPETQKTLTQLKEDMQEFRENFEF